MVVVAGDTTLSNTYSSPFCFLLPNKGLVFFYNHIKSYDSYYVTHQ